MMTAETDPEAQKELAAADTAAAQAMDDLKAILESRTPLYAKANAVVNTGGKSEAQAFAALLAAVPRGNAAAEVAC